MYASLVLQALINVCMKKLINLWLICTLIIILNVAVVTFTHSTDMHVVTVILGCNLRHAMPYYGFTCDRYTGFYLHTPPPQTFSQSGTTIMLGYMYTCITSLAHFGPMLPSHVYIAGSDKRISIL